MPHSLPFDTIYNKTRAGILGAGILIISIVIISVFFYNFVVATNKQSVAANTLIENLVLQRTFTSDYILYQSARAKAQWDATDQLISATLLHYPTQSSQEVAAVGRISRDRTEAYRIFVALADAYKMPEASRNKELEARMQTQLSLRMQEIATDATALLRMSKENYEREHGRYHTVLNVGLALLFGYIVVIFFLIRKQVIRPLLALNRGIKIIAEGNFEHTIDIHGNDEMSDLARSYNEMAHNLKKNRSGLEEKIENLNRLTHAMAGRELRMIELKKQLKAKDEKTKP